LDERFEPSIMTLIQKILKVILISVGILGCLGTMFSIVSPYLIFLSLPSGFCLLCGIMIGSEFPE
jgi:hypothetical protein